MAIEFGNETVELVRRRYSSNAQNPYYKYDKTWVKLNDFPKGLKTTGKHPYIYAPPEDLESIFFTKQLGNSVIEVHPEHGNKFFIKSGGDQAFITFLEEELLPEKYENKDEIESNMSTYRNTFKRVVGVSNPKLDRAKAIEKIWSGLKNAIPRTRGQDVLNEAIQAKLNYKGCYNADGTIQTQDRLLDILNRQLDGIGLQLVTPPVIKYLDNNTAGAIASPNIGRSMPSQSYSTSNESILKKLYTFVNKSLPDADLEKLSNSSNTLLITHKLSADLIKQNKLSDALNNYFHYQGGAHDSINKYSQLVQNILDAEDYVSGNMFRTAWELISGVVEEIPISPVAVELKKQLNDLIYVADNVSAHTDEMGLNEVFAVLKTDNINLHIRKAANTLHNRLYAELKCNKGIQNYDDLVSVNSYFEVALEHKDSIKYLYGVGTKVPQPIVDLIDAYNYISKSDIAECKKSFKNITVARKVAVKPRSPSADSNISAVPPKEVKRFNLNITSSKAYTDLQNMIHIAEKADKLWVTGDIRSAAKLYASLSIKTGYISKRAFVEKEFQDFENNLSNGDIGALHQLLTEDVDAFMEKHDLVNTEYSNKIMVFKENLVDSIKLWNEGEFNQAKSAILIAVEHYESEAAKSVQEIINNACLMVDNFKDGEFGKVKRLLTVIKGDMQ